MRNIDASKAHRAELPLFKGESELDPLLPQTSSAPEISGYGFSPGPKFKNYKRRNHHINDDEADEADEGRSVDESSIQKSTNPSPLRVIISIFIIVVGIAFFVSLLVPGGLDSSWKSPRKRNLTFKARTDKILSETPLIDGHDDLAIIIRSLYNNKINYSNFTMPFENGTLPFHVDLPRLRTGKIGGSFWSAFIGCPSDSGNFSNAVYGPVVTNTLQQIDILRRLIAKYPEVFSSPDIDSTSALTAFKENKIISPLAIEGLHQIQNSFAILRLYRSLDVKYATLTQNCHNEFADAALVENSTGDIVKSSPYWGGLSTRGKLAIQEMNRIGMLVDLSHVSKDTMVDILGGRPEKFEGSLAPIIFSHSSAYALCPHPRNVPDDVLELVRRKNSVIMVNFSPDFISCVRSKNGNGLPDFYKPNSTLHQVARHITYIGDKIGYDHVGIGSDFDGVEFVPKGLEGVDKFPDLVVELLKMGVSDANAEKIVGKNILRVWADADAVAAKMQKEGVLPIEDDIDGSQILA